MSEIKRIGDGGTPMPIANEIVYNGYVMKDSGTSGRLTIATAINDAAFAVVARSSLDPQDGTAEALTAGDEWPVFLLGCGKIVEVASMADMAYTNGLLIYLGTTDGQVTNAHATSTPIGRYIGPGVTTSTADGDLIPVLLCIEPDETPV